MMRSVCILGRQPALGVAELESLYGSDKLHPIVPEAVGLDVDPSEIPFARLGGTVKLCRVLRCIDAVTWPEIEASLLRAAPEHASLFPEGKLTIGLSAHGLSASPSRINATGLSLKKAVRATGRPVRLVPNQAAALNSAQVLHNRLTGKLGCELVLVRQSRQVVLAQTVAVQDIEAYGRRDQARPKRDARVGMLPPKLAQIIINLAHPATPPEPSNTHGDDRPAPESLAGLLDPFCGTGVLLQEALLIGFAVIGSDIDPRMHEYARENLAWLRRTHSVGDAASTLMIADATEYSWPVPFYALAAETYLGRPFSALPGPDALSEVIQDVNTIHRKFLVNVARQSKPGFRMCIAVPAWKTKQGFRHLPVLDRVTDMGYTRISFTHVDDTDLVYYRPGQIVARELVVMTRK